MEIDKLTNRLDRPLNKSDGIGKNRTPSGLNSDRPGESETARVSLREYPPGRDDQQFARIELDKLNRQSFDRLKEVKSRLNEYQQSLNHPDGNTLESRIGQQLNSTDVLDTIAQKILYS